MKIAFTVIACLLSSLAALRSVAAADPPQRPNIVFFLVDDMGWMDCGVYGSQYYETPNIDRFAGRAMRFTNAYAQPLCSPTRASLLTGQYSARHRHHQRHRASAAATDRGTYSTGDPRPPTRQCCCPRARTTSILSQITLAETLKAAGYRTAHIGKWHLGTTPPHWPEQQGFDVAFHCHPDPGPPGNYFSPYGVTADGSPTAKNKVGTITDGPAGEYIVDRQAIEAVKFIRGQQGRCPSFSTSGATASMDRGGTRRSTREYFANKVDPSGRQGNPIMASMLRSVDECFGRILDELDSQGIADNTIVIFYSDNGGNKHSNVPGTAKTAAAEKSNSDFIKDWRKWAGDQPPTRNTPLRDGKGNTLRGRNSRAVDVGVGRNIQPAAPVMPSSDRSTSIRRCWNCWTSPSPSRQTFDGVSYRERATSKGDLSRDAYFNYHPHAGANRAGGVWVRSGDYKLLRWFGNPSTHELYNLREDIGERMTSPRRCRTRCGSLKR